MRAASAWLLVALAAGCSARDERSDPRRELAERVREYVALERRLEADLPPLAPNADAAAMEKRRAALSAKLRAARPDARVFTPRVAAALREDLAPVLAGPDGENVRGAILDENPAGARVEPLGPYPDGAPLSTVPASVLAALPPIPEDVEYRFVGRRLILRDVHANLVVDVLPDAFP
jgi:hypothetical protein